MNEEQWAELLKLREKASLDPKSDYRFQSLEIYLSALYTLNRFSQEDKANFNAQFNELSEQDKENISSRVINKTHPNFFHLTDEEVKKLVIGVGIPFLLKSQYRAKRRGVLATFKLSAFADSLPHVLPILSLAVARSVCP